MDEPGRTAVDELTDRLEQAYGDRLVRVVLFGSHARGAADEASDVDLLVVLEGEVDVYAEIDRLSDLCYEIELEHGVLFGLVPASREAYEGGRTALLRNARREGVPA